MGVKDAHIAQLKKQKKEHYNYKGCEYSLTVDNKIYQRAALDKYKLTSIDVCVPMKGAGSAVIKFASFDATFRNFGFVSTMFNLGSIVEIKMGYGNFRNCRTVFKGFVYMIGEEYDYMSSEESPSFVVTVMDARKLMMINGNKYQILTGNGYTGIIKLILDKYKAILNKIEVTPGASNQAPMKLPQNTNDYDFIMNEIIGCGKLGSDFYVSCGDAYLKPRSIAKPIPDVAFTVTIGNGSDNLDYFRIDRSFVNTTLNVYGIDYDKDTPIQAIRTLQTPSDPMAPGTVIKPLAIPKDVVVSDVMCNNYDDAAFIAQNLADDVMYKTWHGVGKGHMNPDVKIGEYIAVDGTDALATRNQYVTMVRHEIRKKTIISKGQDRGVSVVATTYFETEGYMNK